MMTESANITTTRKLLGRAHVVAPEHWPENPEEGWTVWSSHGYRLCWVGTPNLPRSEATARAIADAINQMAYDDD